jgi:hypothetical protein
VSDARTHTLLANNFCGLVRTLQSAAADEGISLHEFIWPKSIDAEIARLADTIREYWPERFSASNLQKRLGRLALELAAEPIGEATLARFLAFLADLNAFAERKLCVAPVEGVALVSDGPIAFGPFVLRRATQTELDRIHTLIGEALSRTLHTPQEQVDMASAFRRQAEVSLAGSVLLEFEVTGDAEQAHMVFIEKGQHTNGSSPDVDENSRVLWDSTSRAPWPSA